MAVIPKDESKLQRKDLYWVIACLVAVIIYLESDRQTLLKEDTAKDIQLNKVYIEYTQKVWDVDRVARDQLQVSKNLVLLTNDTNKRSE